MTALALQPNTEFPRKAKTWHNSELTVTENIYWCFILYLLILRKVVLLFENPLIYGKINWILIEELLRLLR